MADTFREEFFERIGRTLPETRPEGSRHLTAWERGAIRGARAALELVCEDAEEQDASLAVIGRREPRRDHATASVGYLRARARELSPVLVPASPETPGEKT